MSFLKKIKANTGLDDFDALMDKVEKMDLKLQRNAFRHLCQVMRLYVKDSDLKKLVAEFEDR